MGPTALQFSRTIWLNLILDPRMNFDFTVDRPTSRFVVPVPSFASQEG